MNITKFLRPTMLGVILTFASLTSNSQTNVDTANMQLRALFGNLAKPSPPRLFNWDMAVHTVDSSLFIPINYIDTLSVDNWADMYTEMRNSAYDTIPIKTTDSVLYPCYRYGPDTINMTTMFFDYYRFKPDAMTTNLYFDFDTINDILTDKVVRPGYPYDLFKVFASSPIKNIASRNQVIFRLGTDNLFYDNFNKLDAAAAASGTKMRVDFGDGSGWQSITLGVDNYFPIYYTTAGKYPIQMQVYTQHGSNITVVANSISYLKIRRTRADPYDEADQKLFMYGMNINVYEPCNTLDPQFTKTLIYLEGFDVEDFLPYSGRDAQFIYETQIADTKLSDLRNFGYRIFVVDWQDSRIDMRKNAKNLNDFIEYLKCGNIISDNNEEEFVIIGESMGGVIANYALLQQENGQYTSYCKPRKMHNTRLLITVDSPFEGASVPMGLQKMADYISTHFTGALSVPFLPLAIKHYMKNHNLFADGDAAKQLLMYHVSTESILGPHTYYPHSKRNSFVQDQNNMGRHPKYCKLVAESNGNMMGFGQTRYWDGQPRSDGDHLLQAKNTVYGTILGHKFNLAGVNMEMKTDPNGNGNIGKLSFGTWSIKIKLKWWGIKIYTGFNSICNKDWDANMIPASTSSGGMLDYNYAIDDIFLSPKTYQGSGEWTTNGTNKWGKDEYVETDGFHWCFVPTSSAFDYGVILNNPFDALNINTVFTGLPFHVFYGTPGSTQRTITSNPLYFGINPYVRNNHHIDIRNDSLIEHIPSPHWMEYPFNCPAIGGNMIRKIHLLNREVGDNEIYLENRYLPWDASCSIPNAITVNKMSQFYKYPNYAANPNTVESIYSKELPFIIGPSGLASEEFNTNTGIVNYYAPFSGPYTTPIYNFQECCENFYKQQSHSGIVTNVPDNGMTIFPNPTTRDFVMSFIPNNTGELHYQIIDITGKVVYENHATVNRKKYNYFLPVQLPFSLPLGQYILSAIFNTQVFSNKIIIK